jgi:hypothetical protein
MIASWEGASAGTAVWSSITSVMVWRISSRCCPGC